MVGRKKKTRSKEDRISQLPDDVICHILALLSTKAAVKTSVLSTRWRNLWPLVPGLDLNSRDFGLFSEFVSFVGRFLDFHKDSWIQKLCLSTDDHAGTGSSYLTSWIDVVTRRRIQHLDITTVYNGSDFVDIPLSLYTCGTLVHLRLFGLTVVNAEFVSLPCVKLIDLQYNGYPNYEAILLKLISGSPVLEDLTIIRGWSEKPKVLQVRSKTLKRIHINEFVHVVIDAPLLQCLKTSLHYTKNVTIINSGFPAKVDIDFVGGALDPDSISKRRVIRDILTDISRVRELVISCFSWEDIFPKSDPRPLIQFCYLSRLSVTFCNSDLGMLPNLLKSCPKLESLILELTANRLSIVGPKNKEPKVTFQTIVIPCLVSSLKFVELKSPILGYEGEMDLVRYFPKNSRILEKLRVRFSGSQWRPKRRKATNVILKELIAMPICSSACELLVD